MTEQRVGNRHGGKPGIGLATAAALLRDGHAVTITARKLGSLEEAAAQLGAPDRVHLVAGNAGDAEHRNAAVAATIDRFGRLDALVNNAGINPKVGALATFDLDAFRKILDTNLIGTLGWIQEAYAQWMGNHGERSSTSRPSQASSRSH